MEISIAIKAQSHFVESSRACQRHWFLCARDIEHTHTSGGANFEKRPGARAREKHFDRMQRVINDGGNYNSSERERSFK